MTLQFNPQRWVNSPWTAVTDTADESEDKPGHKVHSHSPGMPYYLSSLLLFDCLNHASPLHHAAPETGYSKTAKVWDHNRVPKLCWRHFFFYYYYFFFVCKMHWSKYQVIMVFWSDLMEHVLESMDLGQSYYCGFHAKAWENPGSLPLFSLAGLYGFSAWQESPILKVLANIVQFVTPRLMI